MMKNHKKLLYAVIFSLLLFSGSSFAYEIFLDRPAGRYGVKIDRWSCKGNEAWQKYCLPMGNGSLGAAVYGGVTEEWVNFTLDSLWSGKFHKNQNRQNMLPELNNIRRLVLDGKYDEAEDLSWQTLGCEKEAEESFGTFQTFGDLVFNTGIPYEGVQNYRRVLDFDNALITVEFDCQGAHYKRTYFISFPDRCLTVRFESSAAQNVMLSFVSPNFKAAVKDGDLVVQAQLKDNNLPVDARVRVRQEGGSVEYGVNTISVKGAQVIEYYLAADTAYDADAPEMVGPARTEEVKQVVDAVTVKTYQEVLAAHLKDYHSLYGRVTLDCGKSPKEVLTLPMDKRLERYREGGSDPDLAETMFQYGRYLMISSSRPGSLPANLQGVWNNSNSPAWAGDYHLNINLQMNYWLTGPANLLECQEPLIDFMDTLMKTGSKTAKSYFEARGWTAMHATNPWGFSAPRYAAGGMVNKNRRRPLYWNYYPVMGPWLAHHSYEHYAFGQDKEYLKNRLWPQLSGSADFLVDYMYKLPDETYTSIPSWSPEHGKVSKGTTTDIAIAREVLQSALELADVLGIHDQQTARYKTVMDNLVPFKIGQYGQLQEWYEDRDDPDDKHRHINHLWPLHPGSQISPINTPELAKAARVTLRQRGDEATGWSLGWKLNFWARLRDGERAYDLFRLLLSSKVYPNLYDAHPPFQIDGNFAATAGICELLLQSHERDTEGRRIIDLLPALPKAWPDGSVSGLRARDGFEIGMSWNDGKIKRLKITSLCGHDFALRLSGEKEPQSYKLKKGETLELKL